MVQVDAAVYVVTEYCPDNNEGITRVPPNSRDTGMIFQNYARIPRLVQDIGVGLRILKKKIHLLKKSFALILKRNKLVAAKTGIGIF